MASSDVSVPQAPAWVIERLQHGLVIPAHPLALTRSRRFDERRQRALTRYYLAAGAGGLAVGVHTTQFAIRDPRHGLLRPVLESVASTAKSSANHRAGPGPVLIAGVCGRTAQARQEAALARALGYHAGLLSLGAWSAVPEREILAHCRAVARELPLFGFYLQAAVGGRPLSRDFWSRFAAIPNVVGIKIAPFDRYRTRDVIHGVATSGRAQEIALYTGNDDHIVLDLLTEYAVTTPSGERKLRMVGGLLGQWACWTRRAVDLLERCRATRGRARMSADWLTEAERWTDANAAIFDAANGFAGCVPGIHEILRGQGLLTHRGCLDPHERLSPGQAREIARVKQDYPSLVDDKFVREHLDSWLA